MSATGLEDSNVTSHVAAGDDTRSANESSANVGQDTTVKVRHNHDVELLGLRDSLHTGVVHNHVVNLDGGVIGGDGLNCPAEQAVGELHDVGLVDASNLLAVISEGESEGELGDSLRLEARNDLEGLDDAGHALVLETTVFTLGVLSDDDQIDVLVAGIVAGDVLDQADGGVDVELLAHGDVETLVAGSADRGVKDTLQSKLVPLKRSDRLAEHLLGTAGGPAVDTGRIDLLPVNGDTVGLEDGLDTLCYFGTDTITRDKGDGVLATELGGLKNIGLDSSKGTRYILEVRLARSCSRKAL